MKRFHVHLSVGNLAESVQFYSALFGAEPTVQKADYAKWMVEDPRINFAISTRGAQAGLNHLGFQLDSDEELKAMRDHLSRADTALTEEADAHCCYAVSDKYWVTDPQGIAWETYHTLGSIPVFNDATQASVGCCAPETSTGAADSRTEPAAVACCSGSSERGTAPVRATSAGCCSPGASGPTASTKDPKPAMASACCGSTAVEGTSSTTRKRSCCS